MKIYTRTGDAGETGLFGGGRVPKDHIRVRAYGAVDELNAVVGWVVTQLPDGSETADRLRLLQHDLFTLGADLATPPPADGRKRPQTPGLPVDRITEMESWMDQADESLPALKAFVLPGGSRGGAALHMARTVCRRAEREVVSLAHVDDVDPNVIMWLNRCSDLFFTLARLENAQSGAGDVEWEKPG
ncbi:MAG: cob(I)yrinic acid a,c-diamide adenosyltransferase [Gemmatimonadota bacterium]